MLLSHVLLVENRAPLKAVSPRRRLGGSGVCAAMAASKAGISRRGIKAATAQGNAWGQAAIGSHVTQLLGKGLYCHSESSQTLSPRVQSISSSRWWPSVRHHHPLHAALCPIAPSPHCIVSASLLLKIP